MSTRNQIFLKGRISYLLDHLNSSEPVLPEHYKRRAGRNLKMIRNGPVQHRRSSRPATVIDLPWRPRHRPRSRNQMVLLSTLLSRIEQSQPAASLSAKQYCHPKATITPLKRRDTAENMDTYNNSKKPAQDRGEQNEVQAQIHEQNVARTSSETAIKRIVPNFWYLHLRVLQLLQPLHQHLPPLTILPSILSLAHHAPNRAPRLELPILCD